MARAPEIVLVEDNPADAELILHSLVGARPDLHVEVLHDGLEALDFLLCRGSFAQRSPDAAPRLVLLDIKLPKLGGVEVLRRLKTSARTRALPVVMLTSSNVERDVVDCYRAGANGFVQKPVDFDDLRTSLISLADFWLRVNEPVPVRAFAESDE